MTPAEQLYAENIELKLELARLRAQIEYYGRKLFGGGQCERLDRAQMLLELGEMENAVQKATELETITCSREKTSAQNKRERDREAFEKLPVTETVVIEPDEVKAESAAYEKISEERTVELDITPPNSSNVFTYARSIGAAATARTRRFPAATPPRDSSLI